MLASNLFEGGTPTNFSEVSINIRLRSMCLRERERETEGARDQAEVLSESMRCTQLHKRCDLTHIKQYVPVSVDIVACRLVTNKNQWETLGADSSHLSPYYRSMKNPSLIITSIVDSQSNCQLETKNVIIKS